MFADRADAGRRLGKRLRLDLGSTEVPVTVLGIPRGGVLVAEPVRAELGAPLDIIVPRKIGAPDQPELAIAAVAIAGGKRILLRDEETVGVLRVASEYLEQEGERQVQEIRRRAALYRTGPPAPLADRHVVIVDDGVATGLTARAAAAAVRAEGAREVWVAAPVAPPETAPVFAQDGIRLVVLETPSPFLAVGRFYGDFHDVSDEEVMAVLAASSG
jgi:putative phosphoribosyl transferase